MNQEEAVKVFKELAKSVNHPVKEHATSKGSKYHFAHGLTVFELDKDVLHVYNRKNSLWFEIDILTLLDGYITKSDVIHLRIMGKQHQSNISINRQGKWA